MFINTPALGFYFPINLQPTTIRSLWTNPPVEQLHIPSLPVHPNGHTRATPTDAHFHKHYSLHWCSSFEIYFNLKMLDMPTAEEWLILDIHQSIHQRSVSRSFSPPSLISPFLSELNERASGGTGSAWSLPKQGSNYQISSTKNAGKGVRWPIIH